MKLETVALGYR